MLVNSNEIGTKIWYVCFDCGHKANPKSKDKDAAITCHTGICDVCGEKKTVTHVRQFGFPVFDIPDKEEKV